MHHDFYHILDLTGFADDSQGNYQVAADEDQGDASLVSFDGIRIYLLASRDAEEAWLV